MYQNERPQVPRTEEELWEELWDQFLAARNVLEDTPLESREDAIADRSTSSPENHARSADEGVIRYRGASFELDSRESYLEFGRSLIPYAERSIRAKRMSRRFLVEWGHLMMCHGFILSFILDDSDDLKHQRAGNKTAQLRSKEAHRKWVAKIILAQMDIGNSRDEAEAFVAAFAKSVIKGGDFPEGFGKGWFESLLSRGELKATYDYKHLSLKRMRALAAASSDDIPPVPEIP